MTPSSLLSQCSSRVQPIIVISTAATTVSGDGAIKQFFRPLKTVAAGRRGLAFETWLQFSFYDCFTVFSLPQGGQGLTVKITSHCLIVSWTRSLYRQTERERGELACVSCCLLAAGVPAKPSLSFLFNSERVGLSCVLILPTFVLTKV